MSRCVSFSSVALRYVSLRRKVMVCYISHRMVTYRLVTLHYVAFGFVTLRFALLRYVTAWHVTFGYVPLRYGMIRYVSFGYVPLRYDTVPYVAFVSVYLTAVYVTLRFVAFRCVSLRFVPFRYVGLTYLVTCHLATTLRHVQAGHQQALVTATRPPPPIHNIPMYAQAGPEKGSYNLQLFNTSSNPENTRTVYIRAGSSEKHIISPSGYKIKNTPKFSTSKIST